MADPPPLPDPLAELPARYDYIRDVVRKYVPYGRTGGSEWERHGPTLSPEQFNEIAEVYGRMARQGDAAGLSAWIAEQEPLFQEGWQAWSALDDVEQAGGPAAPPEPPKHPPPRKLFQLFEILARKGSEPFKSRLVSYCPPAVVPDWSRLPPGLEYLREPAIKWGRYQYDAERARLDRRITVEEIEELRALSKRMRPDRQRIGDWIRGNDTPEASLVFWMRWLVCEFVPEEKPAGLHALLHPDPKSLDWSKLPSRLQYLASPAARFGRYQTMDERTKLMFEMIDEQDNGEISPRYLELAELAERLRSPKERGDIDAWFERFPVGAHSEAALVHALLVMLDDYFPA